MNKFIYPLVGATLVLVFSVSDGFAKGGTCKKAAAYFAKESLHGTRL